MDFRSIKRKELQALCKKHGVPANLTNLEMANRLSLLFKENQKPLTRGRSCLKNLDEDNTGSENSCKDGARKAKKVRFSPVNETFEFVDLETDIGQESPKVMTRAARRRSMLKHITIAASNRIKPLRGNPKTAICSQEMARLTTRRLTSREISGQNVGVGNDEEFRSLDKDPVRQHSRKRRRNAEGSDKHNELSRESGNIEPKKVLRRSMRNWEKDEDSVMLGRQQDKGEKRLVRNKQKRTNKSIEKASPVDKAKGQEVDFDKELMTGDEPKPSNNMSGEAVNLKPAVSHNRKQRSDGNLEENDSRISGSFISESINELKEIEMPASKGPSRRSRCISTNKLNGCTSRKLETYKSAKKDKSSKHLKEPLLDAEPIVTNKRPARSRRASSKSVLEVTAHVAENELLVRKPPRRSARNASKQNEVGLAVLCGKNVKSKKQKSKSKTPILEPEVYSSESNLAFEEPVVDDAELSVIGSPNRIALSSIKEASEESEKGKNNFGKMSPANDQCKSVEIISPTINLEAGNNLEVSLTPQSGEQVGCSTGGELKQLQWREPLQGTETKVTNKRLASHRSRSSIEGIDYVTEHDAVASKPPRRFAQNAFKQEAVVPAGHRRSVKRKKQEKKSKAVILQEEVLPRESNLVLKEVATGHAKLLSTKGAGSLNSPVLSISKETPEDLDKGKKGSGNIPQANERDSYLEFSLTTTKLEERNNITDVTALGNLETVCGSSDRDLQISVSQSLFPAERVDKLAGVGNEKSFQGCTCRYYEGDLGLGEHLQQSNVAEPQLLVHPHQLGNMLASDTTSPPTHCSTVDEADCFGGSAVVLECGKEMKTEEESVPSQNLSSDSGFDVDLEAKGGTSSSHKVQNSAKFGEIKENFAAARYSLLLHEDLDSIASESVDLEEETGIATEEVPGIIKLNNFDAEGFPHKLMGGEPKEDKIGSQRTTGTGPEEFQESGELDLSNTKVSPHILKERAISEIKTGSKEKVKGATKGVNRIDECDVYDGKGFTVHTLMEVEINKDERGSKNSVDSASEVGQVGYFDVCDGKSTPQIVGREANKKDDIGTSDISDAILMSHATPVESAVEKETQSQVTAKHHCLFLKHIPLEECKGVSVSMLKCSKEMETEEPSTLQHMNFLQGTPGGGPEVDLTTKYDSISFRGEQNLVNCEEPKKADETAIHQSFTEDLCEFSEKGDFKKKFEPSAKEVTEIGEFVTYDMAGASPNKLKSREIDEDEMCFKKNAGNSANQVREIEESDVSDGEDVNLHVFRGGETHEEEIRAPRIGEAVSVSHLTPMTEPTSEQATDCHLTAKHGTPVGTTPLKPISALECQGFTSNNHVIHSGVTLNANNDPQEQELKEHEFQFSVQSAGPRKSNTNFGEGKASSSYKDQSPGCTMGRSGTFVSSAHNTSSSEVMAEEILTISENEDEGIRVEISGFSGCTPVLAKSDGKLFTDKKDCQLVSEDALFCETTHQDNPSDLEEYHMRHLFTTSATSSAYVLGREGNSDHKTKTINGAVLESESLMKQGCEGFCQKKSERVELNTSEEVGNVYNTSASQNRDRAFVEDGSSQIILDVGFSGAGRSSFLNLADLFSEAISEDKTNECLNMNSLNVFEKARGSSKHEHSVGSQSIPLDLDEVHCEVGIEVHAVPGDSPVCSDQNIEHAQINQINGAVTVPLVSLHENDQLKFDLSELDIKRDSRERTDVSQHDTGHSESGKLLCEKIGMLEKEKVNVGELFKSSSFTSCSPEGIKRLVDLHSHELLEPFMKPIGNLLMERIPNCKEDTEERNCSIDHAVNVPHRKSIAASEDVEGINQLEASVEHQNHDVIEVKSEEFNMGVEHGKQSMFAQVSSDNFSGISGTEGNLSEVYNLNTSDEEGNGAPDCTGRISALVKENEGKILTVELAGQEPRALGCMDNYGPANISALNFSTDKNSIGGSENVTLAVATRLFSVEAAKSEPSNCKNVLEARSSAKEHFHEFMDVDISNYSLEVEELDFVPLDKDFSTQSKDGDSLQVSVEDKSECLKEDTGDVTHGNHHNYISENSRITAHNMISANENYKEQKNETAEMNVTQKDFGYHSMEDGVYDVNRSESNLFNNSKLEEADATTETIPDEKVVEGNTSGRTPLVKHAPLSPKRTSSDSKWDLRKSAEAKLYGVPSTCEGNICPASLTNVPSSLGEERWSNSRRNVVNERPIDADNFRDPVAFDKFCDVSSSKRKQGFDVAAVLMESDLANHWPSSKGDKKDKSDITELGSNSNRDASQDTREPELSPKSTEKPLDKYECLEEEDARMNQMLSAAAEETVSEDGDRKCQGVIYVPVKEHSNYKIRSSDSVPPSADFKNLDAGYVAQSSVDYIKCSTASFQSEDTETAGSIEDLQKHNPRMTDKSHMPMVPPADGAVTAEDAQVLQECTQTKSSQREYQDSELDEYKHLSGRMLNPSTMKSKKSSIYLIQNTPQRTVKMLDMKENTPSFKREQKGSTTKRTATTKRQPLEELESRFC